MQNNYMEGEIKFLTQNIHRTDYKNLCNELNEKFNIQRTVEGVRKKMAKIKNGTKPIRLSCSKCQRKVGYVMDRQVKKFGSIEKVTDNYKCIKCRKEK